MYLFSYIEVLTLKRIISVVSSLKSSFNLLIKLLLFCFFFKRNKLFEAQFQALVCCDEYSFSAIGSIIILTSVLLRNPFLILLQ